MNIRNRMQARSRRSAIARPAATVTIAGLGAAGALHALWASGSTWPRENADALADLVVGQRPFPSPGMAWGVTGLIGVAAVSVAVAGGLVRQGPPLTRAAAIASAGVALVLGARGVGGLVTSGLRLVEIADEYRAWDLALYSPLCLVLAAGAGLAAAAGSAGT